MRKRAYRSQLRPEINVTPFIDVILVLLIIFMVTAPLLNLGIPLELPQSQASRELSDDKPLVISIKKQNEIYLGDKKLSKKELLINLQKLGNQATNRTIYLRASGGLSYQTVVALMGELSALGFINLVLVTEAL